MFSLRNGEECFVGASINDILADTNGGTGFGMEHNKYYSHKEISEEEASRLGLEYFEKGREAILSGRTKSFFLGRSKDNEEAR